MCDCQSQKLARDKSQNNLQHFFNFLQKWGIFALLENLQPGEGRAICILPINSILQLKKYFALKKVKIKYFGLNSDFT